MIKKLNINKNRYKIKNHVKFKLNNSFKNIDKKKFKLKTYLIQNKNN